jgi:hypothetical protein
MNSGSAITFYLSLMLLVACSWTHHFKVENVSDAPATVVYELRGAKYSDFFADSAVVLAGGERVVHHLRLEDSTLAFSLPPGATAHLATAYNTTNEHIVGQSVQAAGRNNLVWMRIVTATDTMTYTPGSLLEASSVKKTGATVLRIGP